MPWKRATLQASFKKIRSLEAEVTAFFLQPVDVPLVKPRTVTDLLQRYRRGEARIIYLPLLRSRPAAGLGRRPGGLPQPL